jgi:hypothetical protein
MERHAQTVIATSSTWKDDVQFLGLHHDAAVSISVFLVREGGTIPLHSHPEMVVYSQLLCELLLWPIDWLRSPQRLTPDPQCPPTARQCGGV